MIGASVYDQALAQGAVKFPSGAAAWSVAVTYNDSNANENSNAEKKPTPRRFARVQIDRHGKLRRDRVLWTDGARTETWWNEDPPFIMFEDPRIMQIVASTPNIIFNGMRLDESMFGWIRSPFTDKEVRYLGRQCWYFQGAERRVGPQGEEVEVVQVDGLP